MQRVLRALAFSASLVGALPAVADDAVLAALEQERAATVEPLLAKYCHECHSTENAEAEVDLTIFASLDAVRQQPKVWDRVREMLVSGQMPPPESPQPSDEELGRLKTWVRRVLAHDARAQAGDPGLVELRRLDNSEYTYTIRDLTGVDSLDPAREFPVDGAAGEGFTNVGSGQGMSAALVQKYLAAAKEVAAHAVLTPRGIRFSPTTTPRDHTDELLAQIQAFYRRYASDGTGTAVNLQGIEFETNRGGHLPVEKYVGALLANRDALKSGATTVDKLASEQRLSSKYLGTLWNALSAAPQTGDASSRGRAGYLLDGLRTRFAKAKPEDAAALAAEVGLAQQVLWKFNPVGQLGRSGTPAHWQEPAIPLVASRELRVKLPAEPAGDEVVLHLTADSLFPSDAASSKPTVIRWRAPRFEFAAVEGKTAPPVTLRDLVASGDADRLGVDLAKFGKRPDGSEIDAADLCLPAPITLTLRLPASALRGAEFVVTAEVDESSSPDSVATASASLEPPAARTWSNRWPLLVREETPARAELETAFAEFRALFPTALCYERIVPVDEAVTLTLFHRDDDQLRRLMLSDAESAELDTLWDELLYVSQEPLQLVVALEQIHEFATQDRQDLVPQFEAMRPGVEARAGDFKQKLVDSEPAHLAAVLELAARAWRRPLSDVERDGLNALYLRLRAAELPHEEAIRLTLARVFTSPTFLHKLETPAPGPAASPVSQTELASRLSYFLWSSLPDAELRAAADAGRLDDAELLAQTRRMLVDPRIRRLANHFACQWLHVRDFDKHDEKNEEFFPEFAALRADMSLETVLFFEDLFRNNGSILDVLEADHTFASEALAKHYGLAWPAALNEAAKTSRINVAPAGWQRLTGVRNQGRGGILGMATFLASQSGASRTSPILRGNWVYETFLGERLPNPPAGVPLLPETLPAGLTERQLIELHSSAASCARCHVKIDPYGFALEQYDAIGRRRPAEVDAKAALPDGRAIDGLPGLRDYLAGPRQAAFVRQFCKKLLGYALGREVQLSDDALLEQMEQRLAANGYRFHSAVEAIVLSPQFRTVRGEETLAAD
jgi:RNAse (barnase) inhibitor barstar